MSLSSNAPARLARARELLADAVRPLIPAADLYWAAEREGAARLHVPGFLWPGLIQSYGTHQSSVGLGVLRSRPDLEARLLYDALESCTADAMRQEVTAVFRAARFRFPNKKAAFLVRARDQLRALGGPVAATEQFLAQPGRAGKIRFLRAFPNISEKYARNIPMDVCHPEFEAAIAIDGRIEAITASLGLTFDAYDSHEAFYLEVARTLSLTGWELDRLLYGFHSAVLTRLRLLLAPSPVVAAAPHVVGTTPVGDGGS